MEKLLRRCYEEAGIKGANTVLLQKRVTSIARILDGKLISEEEWKVLAEWMLGMEGEKTEELLIKLEENFCMEDESFSCEQFKELQILVSIMVYQYSCREENRKLLLFIICGSHAGYKMQSQYMNQLFINSLDEMRLDIRQLDEVDEVDYDIGFDVLEKKIEEEKKKTKGASAPFAFTTVLFTSMVDVLKNCAAVLEDFYDRDQYLTEQLDIQKEESNIAWWLLNEWSDSYNRPFSALQPGEAVLAIAMELWKLTEFPLGPYAIRQVIYKGISLIKAQTDIIALDDIVKAVAGNAALVNEMKDIKIEKTQPVLMALRCANECGEPGDLQVWRGLFERKCPRAVEELQMSPEEMAYQLYLELELANCLKG